MKKLTYFLILSICILGFGCNNSKQKKYSFNPVMCKDTCFGEFSLIGSKMIGKTLNVYITGFGIDMTKDCCRFSYGEIIHNYVPEDTLAEIVKFHLIDLESYKLTDDTLEYNNDDIKRKVICISIESKMTEGIKTIYDPYNYRIYKKLKE